MFTGIIQGLGRVQHIETDDSGCRLAIAIEALSDREIAIGDSIAVNGVCLTVVTIEQHIAQFDVSNESLSKTCIEDYRVGDQLNLECALTLQTPLGGHIVTGHVDGIGRLRFRENAGDAVRMVFEIPAVLGVYVAQKGSVCIDGVSLTSNKIIEDNKEYTVFELMLVPHTLAVTSLGKLSQGDRVHIEIDVIARYLDRMRKYDQQLGSL